MKAVALRLAVFAGAILGAGYLFRSGAFQLNRPSSERFPVRGIDVSRHQGPIDWALVATEDVRFAYLKATEGRDFTDTRFEANWANAKAAGIARGAYHFFTFCSPGGAQADHFLRVAPPEPGALIPVADVEFVGNCKGYGSLAAVRAQLARFLERVERAWGVPPILYVTPDSHRRVLAGQFDRYSLWIRSVLTQPPLDAFGGWLIWQFSETGSISGVSGSVDLNALRPGATIGELKVPAA
jgi:lysozyme